MTCAQRVKRFKKIKGEKCLLLRYTLSSKLRGILELQEHFLKLDY